MHTVLTKILSIHAVSSTNHQKSYSRPTLCTTKSVWRVRRGVQILLDADKDIDNGLSSDNDLQKSLLDDTVSSLELAIRG